MIYNLARPIFAKAYDIAWKNGDLRDFSIALNKLGGIDQINGGLEQAREAYAESPEIRRTLAAKRQRPKASAILWSAYISWLRWNAYWCMQKRTRLHERSTRAN